MYVIYVSEYRGWEPNQFYIASSECTRTSMCWLGMNAVMRQLFELSALYLGVELEDESINHGTAGIFNNKRSYQVINILVRLCMALF